MITEKVIEFGANGELVGVLTQPKTIHTEHPALVIINAGVLHRVGACRNSVSLARTFAKQGYPCFRFDLHGIGDSGFGGSADEDALNTKTEIKEALDLLSARLNINTFVLHGLCSGARDAFATAVSDSRVVGLSMIDGPAYRTFKYHLQKLPSFLMNPARWINFILVRAKSAKQSGDSNEQNLMEIPVWPPYPPQEVVQAGFKTLVNRGVALLVTYTGSWNDEYNYENQFTDMYRGVNFDSLLALHYMPEANHLMTEKSDRQALQLHLLELLKRTSKKH
jgi:hypothetical protein